MGRITKMGNRRNLASRGAITVDLPEFLVQALEACIESANDRSRDEDQVTLDELLELQLAETLTIGEIALLEQTIPGITAAASQWVRDTN